MPYFSFLAWILGLLVMAHPVLAKNYAFVFGGGGEGPFYNNTIFDESFSSGVSRLKKSGFDVTARFNGGHSESEKIFSDVMGRPFDTDKDPATGNNVKSLLEEALAKDYQAGDQVALVIDTHGSPAKENETSHCVSVGQGNDCLSLDEVKKLRDGLNAKGVKMAIIDLSCHSGSTLNLANDNTCVIAASGPSESAYNDFPEKFWQTCADCNNLEEQYLKALPKYDDRAFPEISSPVGQALTGFTRNFAELEPKEVFYYKTENYQPTYNSDGSLNESALYYPSVAQLQPELLDQRKCRAEGRTRGIHTDIPALAEAVDPIIGRMTADGLRQKMQYYNSLLDELTEAERELERDKRVVSKEYIGVDLPWAYQRIRNPAQRLPKLYFAYLSEQEIFAQIERLSKGRSLTNDEKAGIRDHLRTNPKMRKRREIYRKAQQLEDISNEISGLTRQLYLENYQSLSRSIQAPNPCQDFTL